MVSVQTPLSGGDRKLAEHSGVGVVINSPPVFKEGIQGWCFYLIPLSPTREREKGMRGLSAIGKNLSTVLAFGMRQE